MGFIGFNEDLKVIDYELFDKEDISNNWMRINEREVLKEEISLINRLNSSEIEIETLNKLSDYPNLENLSVKKITPAGEYLRENLESVLSEINCELDNKVYIELTNTKIKKISSREDKLLIQAINSIEDIDESISKVIERFRDWYILYFPELEIINNNENYIKLICENNTREDIIKAHPEYFEDLIESTGADISLEDLNILNDFANSILNLQKSRTNIVEYIENKMNEIAPNLTLLVGATLGAKLIAHCGGVKNLAFYPASTIQIMGAEKALYNYKKIGDKPPKHGLIYQHPSIRSSKWWNRGKISRLLSLKISLAIKRDYFIGKLNPEIKEDFEEEYERIEKENPFPKPKKTKKDKKTKKSKKGKKKGKNKKRKR